MSAERCLMCQRAGEAKRVCRVRDVETREAFLIAECPSCGVMRTLPVPPSLAAHYDSVLGRVMKARAGGIHTVLQRVLLKRELRRIVSRRAPLRMVDVGCGSGEFAAVIHQQGFAVATADADARRPYWTSDISAIPHYQFDYDTYDIQGHPPLDGSTMIFRHVIEHVKDPSRLLARMIEYGASAFYLVVPNAACLERRLLGTSWYAWDPPRHLWHFHEGSLRALCRRLHLTVVAMGYDTIPFLLPSVYRWLRLRGVPAGWCQCLSPKSALCALSAPLNFLLPRNTLWMLASVGEMER